MVSTIVNIPTSGSSVKRGLQTDRTVANKPDKIIKNLKNKTSLLIDIAISSYATVKDYEKIIKNRDLQIEVQRMWGLKTTNHPHHNRRNGNHTQ